MSHIEDRLRDLGFQLGPAKAPVANYLGCKRVGDVLYVSARVSELRGALGIDVTLEEGRLAARETVLVILAIVKDAVGDLDRIASVDKMIGFVHSGPGFTQQPQVIDGASDLLVALWGDRGRHARTATGVAQLPYGSAVQLEMTMSMHPEA